MVYKTSEKRIISIECIRISNWGRDQFCVESYKLGGNAFDSEKLEKFDSHADAESFVEFLYDKIKRSWIGVCWSDWCSLKGGW